MKKSIVMMAVMAFAFSMNVNAQEKKPVEKKKATTEKTTTATTTTSTEKKSCDKKAGCCAKKAKS